LGQETGDESSNFELEDTNMKYIKTAVYIQSSGQKTAPEQPHQEVEASHGSEPIHVRQGDEDPERNQVQEGRLNRFRRNWYGRAKRPSSGRNVAP